MFHGGFFLKELEDLCGFVELLGVSDFESVAVLLAELAFGFVDRVREVFTACVVSGFTGGGFVRVRGFAFPVDVDHVKHGGLLGEVSQSLDEWREGVL